ncbi:2OG-Fe(II) oxygenase [Alcanivorax sp. DP30]|uniref:2OG-Fe(II) oxygenase n=1 Tax=Alcanivorax sp. DP30 TaxID=2606217 RepID=UPI00136E9908|nr:2OG-Fe(II) oxygenase [Alcanivorax sp. DP30]MZR64019.1 2OG-Fe(II) oxygenase [Alcanivorax sp. DP30]
MQDSADLVGGVGGGHLDGLVEGLVRDSFAVSPGFAPLSLVRALRKEARERDRLGEFRLAGIGRRQDYQKDTRIRSDRTCWLKGDTLAQCQWLEYMEALRMAVNQSLFMGLFELESHFAIYGPGDYYQRHMDAFNGNNGRLLSVVLYLNEGWQSDWGGRLRVWPGPDATSIATEVEPRAGTLVAFLSEKIPHEVLAATHERYSIAGWFRCNNTTADWLDPPR